jgi:ribose-phosphate pyrophosphokinase
MIKLLLNEQEVKFDITKFPDGTSQVWKLDESVEFDPYGHEPVILWLFENEGELIHVLQLADLVQKHYDVADCILRVPYLPYGRQDKEINNRLSFALQTFKNALYSSNITRIETFDAHSKSDMVYEDSVMPTVQDFHESIILNNNYQIICFPDAGAAKRYSNNFSREEFIIYFEKVRNQLTGEITGLHLETNGKQLIMSDTNILIVDDICDGGMTFIKVAEALKQYNPKRIDLAVSHGLFSKGRQCLHDAGITNIYTTNSLLRNPEGFKVW